MRVPQGGCDDDHVELKQVGGGLGEREGGLTEGRCAGKRKENRPDVHLSVTMGLVKSARQGRPRLHTYISHLSLVPEFIGHSPPPYCGIIVLPGKHVELTREEEIRCWKILWCKCQSDHTNPFTPHLGQEEGVEEVAEGCGAVGGRGAAHELVALLVPTGEGQGVIGAGSISSTSATTRRKLSCEVRP